MNKNILNTGVQEFIKKNINTDIMSVLLKKSIFDVVSSQELAEQLETKNKCQKKLPTWFDTPQIYYPKKLNIEQASSEITARYKAQIVHGKSLLDLTGGFGIDSYFFSEQIDQITHCEIDKNLSEIAAHNFKILGVKNLKAIAVNGLDFLEQHSRKFDWIFIDPSRRNDTKGKVFRLSDCIPNVPEHLELLFKKSKNILVKTSPLLDITVGISELKSVKEIHIVAHNNEVKELLWVLEEGFTDEMTIQTINLKKTNRETFKFLLSEEKQVLSSFEMPQQYLYEPNAAILKSGAFKLLGHRLQLKKLHEHTHLYTSTHLADFPGRCFEIKSVIPYSKKSVRLLGLKKANITTRNFKESVAEIRKKFKIDDGGDHYLFFTTNMSDENVVLKCKKIRNTK